VCRLGIFKACHLLLSDLFIKSFTLVLPNRIALVDKSPVSMQLFTDGWNSNVIAELCLFVFQRGLMYLLVNC
jgi:hypothetical protein